MYEALIPSKHQTRILLLLPSSDVDSTIRCRLIIKFLDDEHLRYEALSYVWGNPEPSKEIQVNSSICRVGPNLHSALRRLRSENELRRLWVDAVCINQPDNAEKSHQVAQMGRVYSGAEQTIA
ncbi:HET-domain-containing protein [Phaeosphaeriaceae sp. SRC1lsM3a]|nr:HET-domain-containing protein [Stagonospora sp. SRC1lsM3a]